MAKAPAKPKPELTRAQQLTMGLPPKKETTNGKAADPKPPAADPGDQSAQENGNEHAD